MTRLTGIPRGEVWRDGVTGLLWGEDSNLPCTQPEAIDRCANAVVAAGSTLGLSGEPRLPTKQDFEVAEQHGIGVVIPHFSAVAFWSSTPFGADEAWYDSEGELRHMSKRAVDEYFRYRCVIDTRR